MNDQRCFERFHLGLETLVALQGCSGNNEKMKMELTTKDISSGGAFFNTKHPLSEGTEVSIEIVIPLERLNKAKGTRARVNVKGRVLRAGPEGMAIRFDKRFSILPATTKLV